MSNLDEIADAYMKPLIIVAIKSQNLYFFTVSKTVITYPISSSKWGIGNKSKSFQTPLGLHHVAKKIGGSEPIGTIFKYRSPTKKKLSSYTKKEGEDLITSRILHLAGLESGKNKGPGIDSYKRCIYIHGTDEEFLIGVPSSHGCIRMKNVDIIALFDMTPVYTNVLIINQ